MNAYYELLRTICHAVTWLVYTKYGLETFSQSGVTLLVPKVRIFVLIQQVFIRSYQLTIIPDVSHLQIVAITTKGIVLLALK